MSQWSYVEEIIISKRLIIVEEVPLNTSTTHLLTFFTAHIKSQISSSLKFAYSGSTRFGLIRTWPGTTGLRFTNAKDNSFSDFYTIFKKCSLISPFSLYRSFRHYVLKFPDSKKILLFGIMNLANNLLIIFSFSITSTKKGKGQNTMLETSSTCTKWLKRLFTNDEFYFKISPYFRAALNEIRSQVK